jgi:protocatechuate 3,4-dioxygenase beta subunit
LSSQTLGEDAKKSSFRCPVTPKQKIDRGPYKLEERNNLTRKSGSTLQADGEIIAIQGTLLDEACVPISDAIIELWQPNKNGVYQYKKYGKNEKNKILNDENFIGSGTAVTNNLGEFSFITIDSTKINIRVRHEDFKAFETMIHLNDLPFTTTENEYELEFIEIGDKQYSYNIVLKGKNKYRSF